MTKAQKNSTSTPSNSLNQKPKARIVIIDDHSLVRDGLAGLLGSQGYNVVGAAATAAEGLDLIRKQKPDLAILDMSLAKADGLELVKQIKSELPKLPMLIISMHDENIYAERVLRAGARGYIMKKEPSEKIFAAIGQVLRGEIYVSEYGVTERVQLFAARGSKCLASLGWAGDAPGQFNRPEGLGIDAEDRLYVADSCNHRIQVFSRDGKFLRAYGRAGGGPGELSYPYDVRVDPAGRQYVCEFGNSRVQIFDAHDHLLEILGGPGFKPGEFSNPWSIALDSAGNLYVADSLNHRVQKFLRRNGGKA